MTLEIAITKGQREDRIAITSLTPGGAITVTLAGGAAPYTVAIVDADKKKVLIAAEAGDPTKFTIQPSVGVCPAGAVLQIGGANGGTYPDVALSYPAEQLRAGAWKDACKEPAGVAASGAASTAAPATDAKKS